MWKIAKSYHACKTTYYRGFCDAFLPSRISFSNRLLISDANYARLCRRFRNSATWKHNPKSFGGASLGWKHYSGQQLFK